MKLTKKKVFVAALALCLVAILSMGSLAWFSASDEVTNEFMVATSDDDTPDEIFSVDVWEITPENDKEQEGEEYIDILPGDVLIKEPHIENTGYYDQYIRVTVEISDAAAWGSALNITEPSIGALANVLKGYDESIWTDATIEVVNDTVIVVAYYNGILEADEDITVFESVIIPESLTQEQAAAFDGGFTINVKAEAVQTENVGANAVEAFATVGM